MEKIIELKNVTKRFGGITALNKASLYVEQGEVVGLIGDNGAGKSTLIKTLVGVFGPDEGEIIIRGKKVLNWTALKARESGIETVFQDRALCPQQSIVWNIFMGKELRYPFGRPEDRTLTQRELTALNNVLRAALERLWMGKWYPKAPEYSSHFSQDKDYASRENQKESNNVCREVLKVNVDTHAKDGRNVVVTSLSDEIKDACTPTPEEVKQLEKEEKERKKEERNKKLSLR